MRQLAYSLVQSLSQDKGLIIETKYAPGTTSYTTTLDLSELAQGWLDMFKENASLTSQKRFLLDARQKDKAASAILWVALDRILNENGGSPEAIASTALKAFAELREIQAKEFQKEKESKL